MAEIFLLVMITVAIVDQITKLIVLNAKIPHWINKLGPLELYKRYPRSLINSIWFLLHVTVFLPLILLPKNNRILWGVSLIFGGLSNTLDRRIFKREGVVDFIPLFPRPGKKTPFLGNIADLSIIIGSIILIIGIVSSF